MFKWVLKLFKPETIIAAILPILRDHLVFKARTVEKNDGFYLNIYLEVFEMTIIDTDLKLSGQSTESISKKEVLTLDSPIDEVRTNQIDAAGNLDKIAKQMLKNRKN